jgi:hypothetical protein
MVKPLEAEQRPVILQPDEGPLRGDAVPFMKGQNDRVDDGINEGAQEKNDGNK